MLAAQHFKVSSALKDIIGRDLITNDFVAIFELVKNAFDAHANVVNVDFGDDCIVIADDGKGMSQVDILEKWLFVAYSAKKAGGEDEGLPEDYRDRIGRRGYAGSKGIGRFSCDRLGQTLELCSRKIGAAEVARLDVSWPAFEQEPTTVFGDVPVKLREAEGFPDGAVFDCARPHGTCLIIRSLRDSWDRNKLLRLRTYLAKLVNPFGVGTEIRINFTAAGEAEADGRHARKHLDAAIEDGDSTQFDGAPPPATGIVNGPIGNFIFAALEAKTTKLEVRIDQGGVRSRLIDRGRLIYEIVEDAAPPRLDGARVSIDLFYLNRAAKVSFARAMGVDSVAFGNVFLFLNGFRVFPVGEPNDDTFGLNVRKAQGYARYLGTREILGRVDVEAPPDMFKEASSRDSGLIESPRTLELYDAFRRLGLSRLERYVVDVTWADKLDAERLDTSGLTTDAARARIIEVVSRLVGSSKVRLVAYANDLIDTVNERAAEFEDSLKGLAVVASQVGDSGLLERIERARRRYESLQRSERQAREHADAETAARERAEVVSREALARADVAERLYEEEQKRSLFLTAVQGRDGDTLVNLHHQVVIYATSVQDIVANNLKAIKTGRIPTPEDLAADFEQISFQNSRILTVTRFATQANFRLDADVIDEDLVAYLRDYVAKISSMYAGPGFVGFEDGGQSLILRFRPIDVAIIVDNLVSNAKRANANHLELRCRAAKGGDLEVIVEDDGLGIDPNRVDATRIFEKGFSTTRGSGLGLYHVSQVLAALNGTIGLDRDHTGPGVGFIMRIPRPKAKRGQE